MRGFEVFWRHVRVKSPDECWEFEGMRNSRKPGRNYGMFYLDGKRFLAHRFAWVLTNGEIPAGKSVCHTCDNPPCVNPKHLWLGTPRDNKRDCVSKGRHAAGEKHGRAKLTAEEAKAIRHLFFAEQHTQCALATEFKVSRYVIRDIVKGKTWHALKPLAL